MTSNNVKKSLQAHADPVKASLLERFFKTGKGEYAEGDKFLGLTVPHIRGIAKKFQDIDLKEVQKLLASPIHEHRLAALEILVMKFEKANKSNRANKTKAQNHSTRENYESKGFELNKEIADVNGVTEKTKAEIVRFYLKNTARINNWDLVDLSASYILGQWLVNKDRSILYKLADSKLLWERRIAIVSTFAFIAKSDFADTLKLAKKLLNDEHDLIHKAVGWALREVGKKSEPTLCRFLNENYRKMPRTMLRYSIEKLSKDKKERYMKK
jgi:3-methyladenine DNA glycosylase AlkD